MTATATRSRAQSQPLLVAVAVGVLFWFLAALFIRAAGTHVFAPGGAAPILLFAATVPLGWLLIEGVARWGGFADGAVFPVIVTMCLTGLVLDGVALVWFAGLYDLPSESLTVAGAWLLWGVGSILALAVRRSPGLE
jgi:hypothetical protein